MNFRRLLIIALGTAIAFSACDGDDNDGVSGGLGGGIATGGGEAGGGGGSAGGGTGTNGGRPGRDGGMVVKDGGILSSTADGGTAIVLSEAQAAAALSSVNAGEIQVAQAVLQKLTDTEVRGFAEQMISEHKALQAEANNLMTQRGLVPEANPISEALEAASEQLITMLSGMSGRELEAAYLQSQVAMHQQTLSLIDCLIGPALKDATLIVFVKERVRPGVAEHLVTAAALSASFGETLPATPLDTGPSRCDMTCLPQGLLPEQLRIVACPP